MSILAHIMDERSALRRIRGSAPTPSASSHALVVADFGGVKQQLAKYMSVLAWAPKTKFEPRSRALLRDARATKRIKRLEAQLVRKDEQDAAQQKVLSMVAWAHPNIKKAIGDHEPLRADQQAVCQMHIVSQGVGEISGAGKVRRRLLNTSAEHVSDFALRCQAVAIQDIFQPGHDASNDSLMAELLATGPADSEVGPVRRVHSYSMQWDSTSQHLHRMAKRQSGARTSHGKVERHIMMMHGAMRASVEADEHGVVSRQRSRGPLRQRCDFMHRGGSPCSICQSC